MDLLTLFGLLGGIGVLVLGLSESQALASFWSLHGLVIVFGGVFFASMINCSANELAGAFRAFLGLFQRSKVPERAEAVAALTALCRDARAGGLRSVQDAGARLADDGFLGRAVDIALGSGDAQTARSALEREINNARFRHREVANLLRTMGNLGPMFGLLGTLIGIVSVLRNITDAAAIGTAMSTALSSAFYGIAFANLVCVPGAGKLRMRSLEEMLVKELVMTGVLDIVFTQKPPTVVELGLQSFLGAKDRGPAPE